jgi:hypothetical protein
MFEIVGYPSGSYWPLLRDAVSTGFAVALVLSLWYRAVK